MAADQTAANWNTGKLSSAELQNIANQKAAGRGYLVPKLIGQAKGRYVQRELRKQFPQLQFSGVGPDFTDPETKIKYEILSGTESNFSTHGTRPTNSGQLYRFIPFF